MVGGSGGGGGGGGGGGVELVALTSTCRVKAGSVALVLPSLAAITIFA